MSEWQPIETAPTNGTSILAWAEDWTCPAVVSRETYDETEYWEYREELISDPMGEAFPTHWLPLPEPPVNILNPPRASHRPTPIPKL